MPAYFQAMCAAQLSSVVQQSFKKDKMVFQIFIFKGSEHWNEKAFNGDFTQLGGPNKPH